jgi:VWFA-related protein
MKIRRPHNLQFAGLTCALVLLGYTALLPQMIQSSDDSQAGSPIQVTTRLVRVNVLVKRKGAPVTGLTKDDFVLYDEDHRQEIAHFSEQVFNPAAVKSDAGRARTIFSNQYDPATGAPPSVTIILIDALNTSPLDLLNARAQLTAFLHQLQPQDRVALCGLSRQLYVLHDFTTDASAVLAALDAFKEKNIYHESASEVEPVFGGSSQSSMALAGHLEAFLDAANQHAADLATIDRAELTANALAAIANSIVNFPGRKNLVWLSGGFPFQIGTGSPSDDPPPPSGIAPQSNDPRINNSRLTTPQPSNPPPNNSVGFRTFQKEIASAAEALSNANVAIYPVDARGLIGATNFSAALSANQQTNPQTRNPSNIHNSARATAGSTPWLPRENIDTLNELASRTGGVAFYNTNDIKHALRTAVDDSLDSYELDYYPRDVNWNGSFHHLEVKVKEHGLDVRFRRGYVASPNPAVDPAHFERLMQDAIASPLEDADLPITIDILLRTERAPQTLSLRVSTDPSRLGFKKVGDNWNSDVNVAWMQFTADGKLADGQHQILRLTFSPSSYEETQSSGAKFAYDLTLKDKAVRLRIVLQTSTGVVGSVDVPLK